MVTPAEPQQQYFYGTGRRKSAIAKVRIYPDDGTAIIVNDKPMEEYFNWLPWQSTIREPFTASGTVGRFRVMAKVTGGGVNAWHLPRPGGLRRQPEAQPAPRRFHHPRRPGQGKQEVRPETRPPRPAVHQAVIA